MVPVGFIVAAMPPALVLADDAGAVGAAARAAVARVVTWRRERAGMLRRDEGPAAALADTLPCTSSLIAGGGDGRSITRIFPTLGTTRVVVVHPSLRKSVSMP